MFAGEAGTLQTMLAERFRSLLTSHGPYASVYFEDSHDTEDAAAQTELKWRGLREELERQGAAQSVVERLERAVVDASPPVGRSGRALIADADGLVVDEHLIRPVAATVVRVSGLPYIVPVVEHGENRAPYVVVAVDHAGGDVALHRGDTVDSHTVDGGGYPVHKASSAETPGFGDPQPRTEEAQRKNLRAVADRVTQVVDESNAEVVFVVGEVRSRSDFVAALPERVTERVVQLQVGARQSGFHDQELQHEIDQEFAKRRVEVIDVAAQRFTAELGRQEGLATEGLPGVCAALRAGAVETLIIGDIGDATVLAGDDLSTVAPNPEVLSELGTAPTQTLRVDEALPMVAITTGAALVRTDERLTPADGIAAVLRYPLR